MCEIQVVEYTYNVRGNICKKKIYFFNLIIFKFDF